MTLLTRFKEWMDYKITDAALNWVCKRRPPYQDLRDFLIEDEKDLCQIITRCFKGVKLKFTWVDAPERGYYHGIEDLIYEGNPLLKLFKKNDDFIGQPITMPISYGKAEILKATCGKCKRWLDEPGYSWKGYHRFEAKQFEGMLCNECYDLD